MKKLLIIFGISSVIIACSSGNASDKQKALDEKKNDVLDKWFVSHIPNYYVQIDNEFSGCESIKEWLKYTVNSNQ